MTKQQITLLQQILLKQKKDLEDTLRIDITYDDENNELDNEESTSDEMDLAINSNIIDLIEKQNKYYQKKLTEINSALLKIEQNTYGICEESGEEISFERLKANPTARYSIEIQTLRENSKY